MASALTNPIIGLEDLNRVRSSLRTRPRDLLLFDLITQTGIPAQQLLKLKVGDLSKARIGDSIEVSGNPSHSLYINRPIFDSVQRYLTGLKKSENDYLFPSRQKSQALALPSVSRMVKRWLRSAGINNKAGILTLRKGWELYYRLPPNEKTKKLNRHVFKSSLVPIKVPTVRKAVLSELEKAIFSGELPPGKRLFSEEIARQMNVSRMPVREAMAKLEARGYISTLKGVTFVNELSREALEEIIEIRLLLETHAARTAALLCTQRTLQRLEHLHQQYALANLNKDMDEILRLNREFHESIYRDAQKPFLLKLIADCFDRISPYFHILLRSLNDYDHAADTKLHHYLLKGMQRRDPEEVVRWLSEDISQASKLIIKLFDRVHAT
jgi:DNA-binding GntR family transcriptional regulator